MGGLEGKCENEEEKSGEGVWQRGTAAYGIYMWETWELGDAAGVTARVMMTCTEVTMNLSAAANYICIHKWQEPTQQQCASKYCTSALWPQVPPHEDFLKSRKY